MSELKSLNEIFKNSIFRIPDYQRGYSWEEPQLEDFWDDLINLPENSEHYTGMLCLKELTVSENGEQLKKCNDIQWLLNKYYHYYHVVDGQQRLTTIIILIQVIIEFYREKNVGKSDSDIILNDTLLSEIIDQYIMKVKPGSNNIIKTYLFGYEVDKPSDDYIKNKILNPEYEGEINESFYTYNLDVAKNFFKKKISEIYNKENKGDSKQQIFSEIEKIFRKITNKFKFNEYKIENGFNVNIAFETMNNRGKKLSNLELLKNRLIYLSSILKLPKDEENTLIENINETWKTIYAYLGKDKNKVLPDDDFLIAHSYIFFGYIEDIKKSYSQFLLKKYFNQNRIHGKVIEEIEISEENEEDHDIIEETYDYVDLSKKLSKKDILNYINSLKSLVPYWYMLHFSKYNTVSESMSMINNWLSKLDRLEYNYFKPLVLVVLSKKNLKEEEKCNILKYVERYIFLNFRLNGYQATYSRHIYYKLTHELYLNLVESDEIIKELKNISQLSDNNVIDLNLGTLSTINKLFNNSGFYSWKSIRYFLYEYETYLVNKVDGVTKIIDKDYFNSSKRTDMVSIEHIFPQTENSRYWVNLFSEDYNRNERDRLRGSLGNLIPLSLRINKKLQAEDFEKKKERYKIGSYSEMEIYNLSEEKGEATWNAELILERGLKLIKFMEERWKFKFANEADRKKFLGLEFMIEDKDEEKNVTGVINNDKNNYVKEEYQDIEELLYLTMDNIEYATGYYKNNGIVVNKGSKLRVNVIATTKSMQDKIEKERKNNNIQNNVYVNDVYYSTPSLAANVILGNNKNGWDCWKSIDGRTLDELVRKESKDYSLLLENKEQKVVEIFNLLHKKLLNIDKQVNIKCTNKYIGYRVNRNFLELHINGNNLLCYTINGELYKSNKEVKHIPESYGWAFDTQFYINKKEDIDKYWDVIISSYENTL